MLAHQLKALGLTVTVLPWKALTPTAPRLAAAVPVTGVSSSSATSLFDTADLVVFGPGPGDPSDLGDPKMAALRQLVTSVLAAPAAAPAAAQSVPTCGNRTITLTGTATPDQQKTYHLEPFHVPEGTARIEVGYEWTPTDQGVLDLGLWDATGTSGPMAFRFWSGSRQGRLGRGVGGW